MVLPPKLSGAAQIATPGIVVMEFHDTKELAFGSRWEGSLIDAALLNDKDLARVFVEAKRINAILALDRFICNPDRHLENFLYRQMPDGNTLALAFDYSRAWRIIKEPFGLSFLPMSGKKECATLQTARLASTCNSFDKNEALETIEMLNMSRPMKFELYWRRLLLRGSPKKPLRLQSVGGTALKE
jgi:hypothetical protein